MSSKRKEVYWSVDSSPTATNDIKKIKAATVTVQQAKKKTSRRSTLKTLCPEDKHKVRQLIEDLAKTGAEKDAIEQLLKKERNEFDEKLSQLQVEQQGLLEERTMERNLQDSELKLRAIQSQNDKLTEVKSIPVFHSASVDPYLQWSHEHSAPPTTVVNLDHSLNYLLRSTNSTVQPLDCSSSSSSSLISSLQPVDIISQQLVNQQPTMTDNSIPQPHPPAHTELHSSTACTNTGTQTVMVTESAVQTDQSIIPPVVSTIASQPSVITMTSSEFDQKMEHMMATALLNAKDTVNTIEALSQSLLLKNVSRESSFTTLQQQLTSTQRVANNQAVANSQDVVNTPRMTTIEEPANSHISQEYTNHQMNNVSLSGHTPRSHANHVITPPQHNYTLYDTGHHHEDTSLFLTRDDELQLEDLAETLNSTAMGWPHNHCLSMGTTTPCGRKNSNVATATQPVGEHLIINHSDSDVINDLFFLQ